LLPQSTSTPAKLLQHASSNNKAAATPAEEYTKQNKEAKRAGGLKKTKERGIQDQKERAISIRKRWPEREHGESFLREAAELSTAAGSIAVAATLAENQLKLSNKIC